MISRLASNPSTRHDNMTRTSGDILDGKEPDTHVSVNMPLLCIKVWLTTVVHESRVIALRSGIDNSATTRIIVSQKHLK